MVQWGTKIMNHDVRMYEMQEANGEKEVVVTKTPRAAEKANKKVSVQRKFNIVLKLKQCELVEQNSIPDGLVMQVDKLAEGGAKKAKGLEVTEVNSLKSSQH